MIVFDTEFSYSDFVRGGLFEIGAVDFDNPKRRFFGKCRIDDDNLVSEESMRVTGMTEKKIRSKNRITQKELVEKFLDWCDKSKSKNFMGFCINVDFGYIFAKARIYDIKYNFEWRTHELHSIACMKYLQIHKRLPMQGDHSSMGLSQVIELCGMKDTREEHNALEDAELTAECFSRLIYGKNLIRKYKKYTLPEYLKKV